MCIISFRYPKNVVTDILLSILCTFIIILILQNGETTYKSAVNYNSNYRVRFFYENNLLVDPSSEEKSDVKIPDDFDETFMEYNRLQIQQGFDLRDYSGKYVSRYTYKFIEYEGKSSPDDIYATVYVYLDKIIAADVYSSSINGFMRGVINQ